MESSAAETAAQIVNGLAVLAAIPVVAFALWADYFSRHLKSARKMTPGFDPQLERERVRVAGACVLLFELILTVGSLKTLQFYPKSTALGMLACLLVVGSIQAGLERQLVPASLSPAAVAGEEAKRSSATGGRALLLALLSGLLYIVTLVCFVKSAAWISSYLHFSTAWSAAFLMIAAAAGVFFGLTFNFALAPWLMRYSLPVSPMSEEKAAAVSALMQTAGVQQISCWIVEDRHATAAIAGFRWGRWIFRPTLFVSRSVMTSLTQGEVMAVVAHEAAHSLARHLRKRVLLSASLVISLTFLAIFLSLAAFTYFPNAGMQGSFGMVFGATAFMLAFLILQKQSRVHEFEADWIAIQKLGASFENWSSALKKMDQLNGLTTSKGALSSHPRTETRIENVAKMLEYFAVAKKAETSDDHKDRAA